MEKFMVAAVGAGVLVWYIVRPNTLLGGVLTGMVATALGFLAEVLLRSATRKRLIAKLEKPSTAEALFRSVTREHLIVKLERPNTDKLRFLFNPAFERIREHRFYETFKLAMDLNDTRAREFFWVSVRRGECYGFMNQALRAMQEKRDPAQIQIDNNEIIYFQLLESMREAFLHLGTEDGRKSFQANPSQTVLAALPDMAKSLEKELVPWEEIQGAPFSAFTSAQNYNQHLTRLAAAVSTLSGHIDIYGTNTEGRVDHSIAFSCAPKNYLIADDWVFYHYKTRDEFIQALRDIVARDFKDCDQAQATFYIRSP